MLPRTSTRAALPSPGGPRALLLLALWLAACAAPLPDEPHVPVPSLEGSAVSEPPADDREAEAPDASLAPLPPSVPDAGAPRLEPGDAGVAPAAAPPDGGQGPCGSVACSRCSSAGALACGGNGIAGRADTLYRCDGARFVPRESCTAACVVRPAGVPDRCPLGAPPASLVRTLGPKPYVESSCTPTTWRGWPHAARRCTYSAGGLTATVTVANPTPERTGQWIVDAAAFIPRLRALEASAPAQWEQALSVIGTAMLYQSSRIFPLEGGIIENMGSGYVNYPFLRGVTQGCSGGCYCRINSLHRTTYCAFRGATSAESEGACLSRVGASGLTEGWGAQCLANHARAWTRDWNEHFRAMAWKANQSVSASCPRATSCTPAQVVTAVRSAYGL